MSEAVANLDPWRCAHPARELRRKMDSLGRPLIGEQCLVCGSAAGPYLPQAGRNIAALPAWDESIREDFTAARREEQQRNRHDLFTRTSPIADERRDQYREYLQSDAWARKREAILARDEYTCRGCLSRRATQVHHLTYAHIGEELAFELVSLCRACHERVHGAHP